MYKLVILFYAIIVVASSASIPNEGMVPQLDGRIVGGVATSISSFPHQISLQRSGSHSCGGSIYSSKVIITAAHCLRTSASSLRVRAGSSNWNSGGVLIPVAAIKVHEGYNPRTMENDVGVIRLSEPLQLSSSIQRINIAKRAPVNGAAAVVSGWGTQSYGSSSLPQQLQYVQLQIVSLKQCSSSSYGYGSKVKSTMICAQANGKDSCQGDSGGPLVSNGVLVGIVSWGYGCAEPNYPGVYSDAAALRSWIARAAKKV